MKIIEIISPKNTRRDTHNTRKPLFPNWKHLKNPIFEKCRKTQKETPSSSQNVFHAKNFPTSEEGTPFDQIIFFYKSHSAEKLQKVLHACKMSAKNRTKGGLR